MSETKPTQLEVPSPTTFSNVLFDARDGVIHVEGWLPIPMTKGLYEASTLGRIRSVARVVLGSVNYSGKRGRIVVRCRVRLQQTNRRNGYRQIRVCAIPGVAFTALVHVLIADAFLGKCPDGLVVNHKNGVKADNRACNLEYVTVSGNVRHALDVLNCNRAWAKTKCKISHDQADEIRGLAAGGVRNRDLAERFGISAQYVNGIVKNRLRHSLRKSFG